MKIKWEYEDEEADDYEWEYETEEEEGEKSGGEGEGQNENDDEDEEIPEELPDPFSSNGQKSVAAPVNKSNKSTTSDVISVSVNKMWLTYMSVFHFWNLLDLKSWTISD